MTTRLQIRITSGGRKFLIGFAPSRCLKLRRGRTVPAPVVCGIEETSCARYTSPIAPYQLAKMTVTAPFFAGSKPILSALPETLACGN
jgi:hypothetical protein